MGNVAFHFWLSRDDKGDKNTDLAMRPFIPAFRNGPLDTLRIRSAGCILLFDKLQRTVLRNLAKHFFELPFVVGHSLATGDVEVYAPGDVGDLLH